MCDIQIITLCVALNFLLMIDESNFFLLNLKGMAHSIRTFGTNEFYFIMLSHKHVRLGRNNIFIKRILMYRNRLIIKFIVKMCCNVIVIY